MPPLIQAASSFSHMLNLHNLTEEVNSSQTERAVRLGEVRVGTWAPCDGALKARARAPGAPPALCFKPACPPTQGPCPTRRPCPAPRTHARPQVENPVRTTNKSLLKLTASGLKPEQVYEVRGCCIRASMSITWA